MQKLSEDKVKQPRELNRTLCVHAALLPVVLSLMVLSLTGCIMVGGYTSGGGWFLWPGSFGFLFVLLILFLILRRRR